MIDEYRLRHTLKICYERDLNSIFVVAAILFFILLININLYDSMFEVINIVGIGNDANQSIVVGSAPRQIFPAAHTRGFYDVHANNIYHFKQVKVTAGVLNAIATFDVTKQQLSGKMNVSLSMHNAMAPVELKMGGAIDNPTLRYAP